MSEHISRLQTESHDDAHPDDIQLNEYLDGYLPEEQVATLEVHLAACLQCAARVEELQLVFSSLGALPDMALARDLAPEIVATLSPQWKLSPRWKWGVLAQFVLAVVVILVALPPILDTWGVLIRAHLASFSGQITLRWLALLTEWSAQITVFQFDLAEWFSSWHPTSIFATPPIAIWPLFLIAALLFVFGNGLILRKILHNGSHS